MEAEPSSTLSSNSQLLGVKNSTTAESRERRTEPLEVANEPEADGLTPERAGDVAGMRDELQRALASLPESLRAVVVLKDVYQWTHAEIGEQLGISVTAAKVRLHRGRKRLRDALWHVEEDR